MKSAELRPGTRVRHKDGQVAVLERRKEAGEDRQPGWWIEGGGGLSDSVLDKNDGDWTILGPCATAATYGRNPMRVDAIPNSELADLLEGLVRDYWFDRRSREEYPRCGDYLVARLREPGAPPPSVLRRAEEEEARQAARDAYGPGAVEQAYSHLVDAVDNNVFSQKDGIGRTTTPAFVPLSVLKPPLAELAEAIRALC